MNRFLVMISVLLLAACGGGGGSDSGDGILTPSSQGSSSSSGPQSALLTIIFPAAIADELPDGHEITITLVGQGPVRTETIPEGESQVVFEGTLYGSYSILVEAKIGNLVLGSGRATTLVSDSGASIEVPVTLNKASLTVAPIIGPDYSALNGEYQGNARATECLDNDFTQGFGWTSVTTTVAIQGADITMTIEFFPSPTLQLTGTIDDSTGILTASGSFQGSDFTSGEWSISELLSPDDGLFFASIELSEECDVMMDLIGLKPY